AGAVDVTNGGSLTSAGASIGDESGSSGVVHITDAGSSWGNSGALHVGVGGSGEIFIQDSGQLSALGGATIASQDTYTASITVDGVDALFVAGDDSGDQLIVGDRGGALLEVTNQGAVTNAGDTTVGNQLGGIGTITAHNGGIVSTNGLTIGAA